MAAEEKGTLYRVSVYFDRDHDGRPIDSGVVLRVLGEFRGHGPKAALDAALEAKGLPSAEGGKCVVVPVGNWHEFDVVGEQKTVYGIAPAAAADSGGQQALAAVPDPDAGAD